MTLDVTSGLCKIDHTAKGGLTQFWELFTVRPFPRISILNALPGYVIPCTPKDFKHANIVIRRPLGLKFDMRFL